MWTTLVGWLQTLAGTLIGIFAGAVLTQRSQDRQFARQRRAQRLDRAREAFEDAAVIGLKLLHKLELSPTHRLYGPEAATRLADVPELVADLLRATVRLQSEGAEDVADNLGRAGSKAQLLYGSVASQSDVIAKGAEAANAERLHYHEHTKDLTKDYARFRHSWLLWINKQETLERSKKRKRPPRPAPAP